MEQLFNVDQRIDHLALDIKDYLTTDPMGDGVDNPEKCAWELAKFMKEKGRVHQGNISRLLADFKAPEAEPEVDKQQPVAAGNLSKTMRDMYVNQNMEINEIAKALNKKYVRVKNVIKKLPEYKARAQAKADKEEEQD